MSPEDPAPGSDPGSDNETPEILIRDVADADIPAIQEIYARHVLEGLASFDFALVSSRSRVPPVLIECPCGS